MGDRLDLAPFAYLEKLGRGWRERERNKTYKIQSFSQIFYTSNILKGKRCLKVLGWDRLGRVPHYRL